MEVQLLDKEGKLLCVLDNDDALLGAYPVDDNMRLHVCFINLLFIHWGYNVMLLKIMSYCIINVKLAGGDPHQFQPVLRKWVNVSQIF